MQNLLSRLFTPPVFAERDKTRTARWLYLFTWAFIAMMVLLTIPLFSPRYVLDNSMRAAFFYTQISVIVIFSGALVLIRRGYTKFVAWMICLMAYFMTLYIHTAVFGTLRTTIVIGYFVLIPLTGLFFGGRIMMTAGFVSTATVIVTFILEYYGKLGSAAQANLGDLELALYGIVLNATLVRALLSDMEASASEARRSAAALSVINRELESNQSLLQQARDQLELRVNQRTAELADANAQLKAEIAERQQSENRFRSLAENSPDFIYILDLPTQEWIYYNRSLLLSHPAEAIADLNSFLTYVHPDERAALHDHWQWLMNTGEDAGQIEYRMLDQDGQWQWLQSREAILDRNEAGQPSQVLANLTLITERKQHEQTLRSAKELAEAATRAKSEFLANMSHEIRTPMNGVVGMTSLLLATRLSPDQRVYVETIRQSSDTLLTIINDILDLSKAEFGKLGLDRQPLDVRRCVEETLDLLAPKAAEKHLELCFYVAPLVPQRILGDSTRLRQILVNLLSNAVKFTQEGDVCLTVEARPLDVSRTEIHFAIHDSGIGIAPDHLQALFQPFSQVDTSNTRKYGGTGLGLAISKRLCELMGGEIWAESQELVGSTFHFTIVADVPEETDELAGDTRSLILRGRRVLVIDDNQVSLDMLSRHLQTWDMDVNSTTQPEALRAWLQSEVSGDFLLVDEEMPGLSGLQLAKEALRLHPDLGVLLLATIGDSQSRQQAEALGMRVVYKPVKPQALHNELLGLCGDPQVAIEPHHNESGVDLEMGSRYPLRILLAEDNMVNQKVALRMLKRLGYDADVAATGLETFNAFQKQAYDVILMDVQMPEMDGLEATRRIRAEQAEHGTQPYIIAMTAAAMQLDKDACLEAGMNDFISKPTRVENLVESLERYLRLYGSRRDSSSGRMLKSVTTP